MPSPQHPVLLLLTWLKKIPKIPCQSPLIACASREIGRGAETEGQGGELRGHYQRV